MYNSNPIRSEFFTEKRIQSLWKRILKKDENFCWEWQGTKHKRGYGRVYWKINGIKKSFIVTRLMFYLYHKLIPDNVDILHTCDNPSCVSFYHLIPGSHNENMNDMKIRGRVRCPQSEKTHCKWGHKFSIENTFITKSGRRCKVCNKRYRINSNKKKEEQ